MAQARFESDLHVTGTISAGVIQLPASSVGNADIEAAAGIAASKVVHQAPGAQGAAVELFGPTTAVTALTKTLGMAYASGTLVAFTAWIEVVATGADRTVTVDLQKSTGAGAYATVLSATAGFTNASAVRTAVSGTISTTPYVAGDIFRAVVTVAGAAGNQATGLSVRLMLQENPA